MSFGKREQVVDGMKKTMTISRDVIGEVEVLSI